MRRLIRVTQLIFALQDLDEYVLGEILRIGDRALAGATTLDGFLKQVQTYELETIRDRSGQRVWQGELDIASRLNEDVTTAIPVSEAVAVILQVVYFRLTKGQRLFKMAPLHHHFELIGWSETQIVQRFWLVGLLFALLGIAVALV